MSKRMAAYLAAAACVAVLWSAPALLAQAAGQDNAARKGSAYMTVLPGETASRAACASGSSAYSCAAAYSAYTAADAASASASSGTASPAAAPSGFTAACAAAGQTPAGT